ncbi:MAG: hypothetical protein QNK37_27935 [Acidobacteriota bacterium]|nr:hypothetical protein [Acidobacteriota bacterium]
MAEQYIIMDQLAPDVALQLLAEACTQGMASWLQGMTIDAVQSAFGNTASLVIPESVDTRLVPDAKEHRHHLDRLANRYRELTGGEPRRGPEAGGMDPASGLVWLILNSEAGDEDFETVARGEFLLVVRDMSTEEVAELFEDLRFHATHTRVAGGEYAGGTAYIFHMRDDAERLSSLQSLIAGDRVPSARLLTCRRVNELALFLPPDCHAGETALDAFCRILLAMPQLLQVTGDIVNQGLFTAIDPQLDQDGAVSGYEILYLGRLAFQSQSLLAPEAPDTTRVHFRTMVNSDAALSNLRSALGRVQPRIGYSLELRRTRFEEAAEIERTRLLERQAELDYRIAYLDSISMPRPKLLRFSQQQLPALADVVRGFPMKVLREGYPLYGFQSHPNVTGGEPKAEAGAGYHYIMVEPEDTVFNEMDPLPLWEHLEGGAMRFQLDPFWARYYHGQGNECLIFVPEGCALFPTMHGWDVESMDTYMRETMDSWFAGRGETVAVPEKPIYIFDGAPEAGAPIHITVLDRKALAPLRARLGWINDHLSVADAMGLEKFVREMASDVTRSRMIRGLKADAQLARIKFDELLQETNQHVAERLDELTSVITEEFNHLVAETHQTTVKIKEYHDYLEQLTVLKEETRETAERGRELLDETEDQRQEVARYLIRLEEQVERELSHAYKVRRAMIGKVARTIRELGTTHQELKEQLKQAIGMK